MDPTTQHSVWITFCYPVVTYDVIEAGVASTQASITVSIGNLINEAAKATNTSIMFSPPETVSGQQPGMHEFKYTISISGTFSQAFAARGFLLRNSPTQKMTTIKTTRRALLNDNGEMKAYVKKRVDEIMKTSHTQITCLDNDKLQLPQIGSAYRSSSMDVEIIGQWDSVERARMRILVLLDEMNGLYCESVEIDPRLHSILSGRKRDVLESIMQQTMTNIYMPTAFIAQAGCKPFEISEEVMAMDSALSNIYITGEPDGVRNAREQLLSLLLAKNQEILTKNLQILPRKIDWILLNRQSELLKIMSDNGVHISCPPLGSNNNTVMILGDDRVHVERAARVVLLMASEFYVACIHLAGQAHGVSSTPFGALLNMPEPNDLHGILGSICRDTNSEVVIQQLFVEIYGGQSASKSSYQRLAECDFVKSSLRDTKFQLELALEHREFINGKKNGKINKIIKTSGCKIVFQDNINNYNMLIDIYNPIPSKAIEGLILLEDELPAEISFYVPEAYHKRIIGVGGKNIQRIMKKYGVYVKFSNADEFSQLGGYYENNDNVIARTPAKNASNLEHLKESIMELVNFSDKHEITTMVNIPRVFHRLLSNPTLTNIYEIANKTKIKIIWPQKELGSDGITLQGAEPYVHQAAQMILDLTPEMFEFSIPATQIAGFVLRAPEFNIHMRQRLKIELGLELLFSNLANIDFRSGEISIFLHHLRGNPNIELGQKLILEYLSLKQVPINLSAITIQQTGPSFGTLPIQNTYDSFQHFNSKLLAPVTAAPGSAAQTSGYNLFEKGGSAFDLLGPQPNQPPGPNKINKGNTFCPKLAPFV
ncbi:hypothetical protein BJ742DRAFT_869310 [Cladochytrium replicatum]|nr:hypothetical protein BJ742DRAFT_869310 [Cladochytrium replicatum]